MKAKLLSSTAFIPEAFRRPDQPKPTKPVPMIGTMQKDATAHQRRQFAKMKHELKKTARAARYNQRLQEEETRDKP